MINNILNYLKDKKIAILGFGLEGKSTYNFLRRYLPDKEIIEYRLSLINNLVSIYTSYYYNIMCKI